MKVSTIYPRDILAFFALLACFILIALGIDHIVSGIAIMIITYYFSKRVYEEKNPNGNLNDKVQELEAKVNGPKVMTAKFKDVIKPIPEIKEPFATGDFHPVIKKEIN